MRRRGRWRSAYEGPNAARGKVPLVGRPRIEAEPAPPPPRHSMPRVHQRRHREELVADPRLLALIEVPALLAREAQARQRRPRRVLELQVDHDDGGLEADLVRVLDHARGVEGLLLAAPVVDPD